MKKRGFDLLVSSSSKPSNNKINEFDELNGESLTNLSKESSCLISDEWVDVPFSTSISANQTGN